MKSTFTSFFKTDKVLYPNSTFLQRLVDWFAWLVFEKSRIGTIVFQSFIDQHLTLSDLQKRLFQMESFYKSEIADLQKRIAELESFLPDESDVRNFHNDDQFGFPPVKQPPYTVSSTFNSFPLEDDFS